MNLTQRINRLEQSYPRTPKQGFFADDAKLLITVIDQQGKDLYSKLIDGGIFKMKSAQVYRYIKVAEYSAKLSSSRNLQEAYKLIESEESKKKQAEQLLTTKQVKELGATV